MAELPAGHAVPGDIPHKPIPAGETVGASSVGLAVVAVPGALKVAGAQVVTSAVRVTARPSPAQPAVTGEVRRA